MRLSKAENGKTYWIYGFELSKEKKHRIMDLGLTNHTKITVINQKNNGPMIVSVRGTRLAMGQEILNGIIVEEMLL